MRDRKKRNITIISLCCLLVFMAVGYAVLSQTLNIDGTANLTGEWNIYIESITATKENGNAISKSAIVSEDKLSAEFLVELEKPGDYVEYNVVVTNGGNIDASLRELITEETNPHKDIKFSHTAKQGEVLTQKTSTEFTVKVEFDRNATTVTPGEIATYKIRLNYEQYEGNQLYAPPKVDTDNSCFKINAEGTITDYDESCGTYVTVPKEIDGITVKTIGSGAFAERNLKTYQNPQTNEMIAIAYTQQVADDFAKTELGIQMQPLVGNGLNYYIKENMTTVEYNNLINSVEGYPLIYSVYVIDEQTVFEYGRPYVEYLDLSPATELIYLEPGALGRATDDYSGSCLIINPLKQIEFGKNSSLVGLGSYNFSCLNMQEMHIPKSVVEYRDAATSSNTDSDVFIYSFVKKLTIYSNATNITYPYSYLTVEDLTVYLGDSDFAYNGGFESVTNTTIGEGITQFNIPYRTQKLIVPSTIESISDIKGSLRESVKEVIFMHKTKPSFYGDTSWYDSNVTTVSYPNID